MLLAAPNYKKWFDTVSAALGKLIRNGAATHLRGNGDGSLRALSSTGDQRMISEIRIVRGGRFGRATRIRSNPHSKDIVRQNRAAAPLELYTLESDQLIVKITNYGGRVVEIRTPDKTHTAKNILDQHHQRFRQGRRLRRRQSVLRRPDRALRQPHRTCDLQAGRQDVHAAEERWRQHAARRCEGLRPQDLEGGQSKVPLWCLTYTSADGEEGFPGTLTATVTLQRRQQRTAH